jgi:hypothetical protein
MTGGSVDRGKWNWSAHSNVPHTSETSPLSLSASATELYTLGAFSSSAFGSFPGEGGRYGNVTHKKRGIVLLGGRVRASRNDYAGVGARAEAAVVAAVAS